LYNISNNCFIFRKSTKSKQKNVNKKNKKNIKDKQNLSLESTDASNFNMNSIVDYETDEVENEMDISIYYNYFRELDIDTWLILTQKFIVNPEPEHVNKLFLLITVFKYSTTKCYHYVLWL